MISLKYMTMVNKIVILKRRISKCKHKRDYKTRKLVQ